MEFLTEDEVLSCMQQVNRTFKKDDRVYRRAAMETKRLSDAEYKKQSEVFRESVNQNNVPDLRDIPAGMSLLFFSEDEFA